MIDILETLISLCFAKFALKPTQHSFIQLRTASSGTWLVGQPFSISCFRSSVNKKGCLTFSVKTLKTDDSHCVQEIDFRSVAVAASYSRSALKITNNHNKEF